MAVPEEELVVEIPKIRLMEMLAEIRINKILGDAYKKAVEIKSELNASYRGEIRKSGKELLEEVERTAERQIKQQQGIE